MRVSIAWLGAVTAWAEREGASRRKLLDAAGLTDAELEDPASLPTDAQEVELWRAVVAQLKRPSAGLDFGSSIHSARAFGVVGFLGRVADHFRQSLDHIVHFHRLLGLGDARVSEDGGMTTLAFSLSPALLEQRQSGDAWAAAAISAWRATTFKRGVPREVRFAAPAPERPESYQRFFGCPLRFDCAGFAVDWDSKVLLEPIPTKDPMSRKQFERTAERALAKLAPDDPVSAVQVEIRRLLEKGAPTLATVGKRLGQSSRTLQRRLEESGTSFAKIVDETRRTLALELVQAQQLPLQEIAWRTGFSDPSAFRRAFRRWFGHAPLEERKQRSGA